MTQPLVTNANLKIIHKLLYKIVPIVNYYYYYYYYYLRKYTQSLIVVCLVDSLIKEERL